MNYNYIGSMLVRDDDEKNHNKTLLETLSKEVYFYPNGLCRSTAVKFLKGKRINFVEVIKPPKGE
jgi:hypothetical protein